MDRRTCMSCEQAVCGEWDHRAIVSKRSLEFIERIESSEDYCSFSLSVVFLQWKMWLFWSFLFHLLTYLTFFPTRKMLTLFWLRHTASRDSRQPEGSVWESQ